MSTNDPTPTCRNCGTALQGRFCHVCGQEELKGFPSVGRLLGDFFASVFETDSRLWRTLLALMLRPGVLTEEFFAGRRARYIPPFRLYLISSLSFFLLLSLTTDLSGLINVAGEGAVREPIPIERLEALPGETRERLERLEREGDMTCDIEYSGPFADYVTLRLTDACIQFKQDGGYALAQRFLENLPTAMFFLMPLFAGFMRLFYWRPRRHFTEHLVFQVHNHSAFFIVAIASQSLTILMPTAMDGRVDLPLVLYLLWYCYRSLRNYYGQSRGLTLIKLFSLGYIYLLLALLVALTTGVASAL